MIEGTGVTVRVRWSDRGYQGYGYRLGGVIEGIRVGLRGVIEGIRVTVTG